MFKRIAASFPVPIVPALIKDEPSSDANPFVLVRRDRLLEIFRDTYLRAATAGTGHGAGQSPFGHTDCCVSPGGMTFR